VRPRCRSVRFHGSHTDFESGCGRERAHKGEGMDIAEWRVKIDEIDRQIVALLSERAKAAKEIGRLKRSTSLPVYEPNRERVIFENVRAANKGPLPDIELTHVYERIIDVMRALQKDELASQAKPSEKEK
jgi:chorismate mutase